jgi:uncharacterized protein (AIM24 family)
LYILEEPGKKRTKSRRSLKVDTGCIVGFTKDVDYDIEFIGGIKNSIFGGEGLFYATLHGPGTVYIQSYLSADSLTELLLQHQKQVEIAEVKEAYLAG